MGGGHYDYDTYTARSAFHKKTGTSMFTHTSAISSGKAAAAVHEKLDPSKPNTLGKIVRESFDSPDHPCSRPIAVLFDVTGSMGSVPGTVIKQLDKLMAALVKKGYVTDPHVLFGAIGDATCDRAPLQLGQFESNNEMDECLSLFFVEGGGGGQIKESYELAMYYMARHTDLDSVKKRNEKGYLFIIGDELPYSEVDKEIVKNVIGDTIQADIPTTDILEELKQKFDVFWILPKQTSYYDSEAVIKPLAKMFGQRFIKLEDPAAIVELIVSTIGVHEGFDIDDITKDLADVGLDKKAIKTATMAVDKFKATLSPKTVVKGKMPVATVADAVERL